MVSKLEKSPLRKFDELSSEQVLGFEKAIELGREFPNAISILPIGSTIYHKTNDLRSLLSRNRFDSMLSKHDGAFFFSDIPVPHLTNCQIAIPTPLILIERPTLFKHADRFLEAGKGKGIWEGAMNLGIDGRVGRDGDVMVRIAEEEYATELLIFKKSLPKLGNISPYKGKYPTRYTKPVE